MNIDYNYSKYWKGEDKFKKKERYYKKVYEEDINKGYHYPKGLQPIGVLAFLLLPIMAMILIINDCFGWGEE